ncbi:MAG: hypothetical protein HC883_03790 [Bdellovibrionaceae bacterium]|nr:hypothetical protein [Pseudobdellovibrionaceae bacterium]
MKICVAALLVILSACRTSRERVLSQEEANQYGLTAVIYDAPLCPNKLEDGVLKVNGPCEEVTCLPERGKIVCRARKRPTSQFGP